MFTELIAEVMPTVERICAAHDPATNPVTLEHRTSVPDDIWAAQIEKGIHSQRAEVTCAVIARRVASEVPESERESFKALLFDALSAMNEEPGLAPTPENGPLWGALFNLEVEAIGAALDDNGLSSAAASSRRARLRAV